MTNATAPSDHRPRVFISYSHESDAHKAWVLAFASALVNPGGIEVVLDRWHLHDGDDKTHFMEQSVTTSDYVLVVCTPAYAQKANDRNGGVGYEAMILTGALGQRVLSRKFIPVLRTGEWEDATPLWLGTRIGPDLRGDPCSPEAFEQLLRTLYGAHPRPPAPGPRPTFAQPAVPRLFGAAHASQTRPPVPFELPPPAEKFFGRQAQLAALTERLRSRRNTVIVGDAGFGKTALAAQAIREVTGTTLSTLAASPYPDGVVFLDLYVLEGSADRGWDELARRLTGLTASNEGSSRQRASAACLGRHFLLVIEGAEEATGQRGRATLRELRSVLAPENRSLLLSRTSDQIDPREMIRLPETLDPEDAAQLFDYLTDGTVTGQPRSEALGLLAGHPLALTWACKRLLGSEDVPETFVAEWKAARLPGLSDPEDAKHTLAWLYGRSVRGLPDEIVQTLAAAGLLGFAPVPASAIAAALDCNDDAAREHLRLLTRRGLLRSTRGSTGEGHWQFTHILGYAFARDRQSGNSDLRVRLGQWLHGQLTRDLAVGAPPGKLSLAHLLVHLAALLRTDADQSLWQPLAQDALYDVVDRLGELGRLEQVKLVLESVGAWLDQFPAAKSAEPDWLRERSVLHERTGNAQLDQGDLAAALNSYRESFQLRRRLAQADPSNLGWQRHLSVSLERVGDVLMEQGDLAAALDSYRESLQLRQRLAQADPSNLGWQRDLSVSLNKVGDVLKDQGDLAAALDSYRESLQLIQRLAQADPSNLGWQRDLSISLTNIALLREKQGDRAEALGLAQESLRIAERLSALDGTNATWRRDLQFSRRLVERLVG